MLRTSIMVDRIYTMDYTFTTLQDTTCATCCTRHSSNATDTQKHVTNQTSKPANKHTHTHTPAKAQTNRYTSKPKSMQTLKCKRADEYFSMSAFTTCRHTNIAVYAGRIPRIHTHRHTLHFSVGPNGVSLNYLSGRPWSRTSRCLYRTFWTLASVPPWSVGPSAGLAFSA